MKGKVLGRASITSITRLFVAIPKWKHMRNDAPKIKRHFDRPGSRREFASAMYFLVYATVAVLLLSGCASQPENRVRQENFIATADFYWHYAALAAAVYKSKGVAQINSRDKFFVDSTLLARAIHAQTQDLESEQGVVTPMEYARKRFFDRLKRRCSANAGHAGDDIGVHFIERTCGPNGGSEGEGDGEDESEDEKVHGFAVDIPQVPTDCEYIEDRTPRVPLETARREMGWEPIAELRRNFYPRGWSVFVPGLEIDVWRRPRSMEAGTEAVEYALVYRGTADAGGWLSNLRAVTAFTPLVWDQYRQARKATVDLVNRIYSHQVLADALAEKAIDTKILITAVGHSLGGGLANYVFLRIPQITRVVAFDPSPVNGSSLFSAFPVSPEEAKQTKRRDRRSVMNERRLQNVDLSPIGKSAPIHVLYEEGEILTRLIGCNSGPMWGDEGGPSVSCHSLDLSGGSALKQHNMAALACKLWLVRKGHPTR
ncbi:hypothetical protein BURK2_01777 [Burkholderiales bacterium]|nr:hypothetical protein BURK2_01777 [Burkholderiales bacterium]